MTAGAQTFPPDPRRPLPEEPGIPVPEGRRLVLLVDASSQLERRMIEAWAARSAPVSCDPILLAPSRRQARGRRTDPGLAARLQRGDDPWVVPARVVWLPAERHGRRTASWSDLLQLGDPRDPGWLRQQLILSLHPERVRIVAGEGAGASELVAAHRDGVEVMTLTDFVTRRAHLTLERAERALRGNRYKVPRFLHDEILGRAEFRDGVLRVASESGMRPEAAFSRARAHLREIAASHSPFLIDLIANAIHWLYRRGYGSIRYDPDAVAAIAHLGQEHPIAFLPSHRSHFDRLSLQYLLWENDLPPNHTAAGINMSFFPVGPLIRRTGAFFIRRSFKDNPLYKHVLRSYLDYLIEKRFPLEWYMEGGRSRSGKLLPPRFGLLGWVVDAVRRGKAEDLHLVPTSIAYDQIQDVAAYAREAQGAEKERETFGWALRSIRSFRHRYGDIHVRFADPISVTKEVAALAGDPDTESVDIDLQKLAFEVMYRISRVTPITPTSLVSIALLAAGGPLRAEEVTERAEELARYVEERGFPTTEPLRLGRPAVRGLLRRLVVQGSLAVQKDGAAEVFLLDPDQALELAYYRNMVVHFFVPGAMAEVALLGASGFWDEVLHLRDLLKFDFYFPEREELHRLVADDLALADPGWEASLGSPDDRRGLLHRLHPLRAHWALLPLLEAYLVVADQLVATEGGVEEKSFLQECLARGRRYRQEGRVAATESVSKVLCASALSLAANRGLVEGGPRVEERRQAFAAEVADLCARAREVGELAESARAGHPG